MRIPMAPALLFAGIAAIGAGPAPAEALLRIEQRWVEALERRDAAAVDAILADDFLDATYRGEIRTKEEALAALRSPDRADAAQRLSELKVRVYGAAGVVTGINTVTARDGTFSVRVRFTDVFVRRNGRWRAVSAQETLVQGGRP